MKERIIQVMEQTNLTYSRFAEEIGIQRAAMSHIINGRNNPSLDVITKILQRYPEINSKWLLFGKGNMYEEKAMPNLFTNTSLFPPEDTIVPEYRKEIEPKQEEIVHNIPQKEEVIVIEKPPRNVTKIMLFYSDNTYDTFIPEIQEDK